MANVWADAQRRANVFNASSLLRMVALGAVSIPAVFAGTFDAETQFSLTTKYRIEHLELLGIEFHHGQHLPKQHSAIARAVRHNVRIWHELLGCESRKSD